MIGNCSGSSHIQPRQIFDLTDLLEKNRLFCRFEQYCFENCYYYYINLNNNLNFINNENKAYNNLFCNSLLNYS